MSSDRIDELKKRYDENPRRFFASLANEHRKAGDLEQAIALCQMHLAEQPANMNGHVVYGQALFESGRYDEAKASFVTALTLDSENLIALRHLGDIACANGANDEAREWYGRVLDSDPRNHEILALLAQLAKESSKAAPAEQVAPVEPAEPEYAPAYDAPAYDAPAYDAPAYDAPAYDAPAEPPAASAPPEPQAPPAVPASLAPPAADEPPVSIRPLSERMGEAELSDEFASRSESLVWLEPLADGDDAAAIEPPAELPAEPLELPSFDDGSFGTPLTAAALTPDVFGDFMPDPFADTATSELEAWEPQAEAEPAPAAEPTVAAEMPEVAEPTVVAELPEAAEPPETPAEPAPPFVTETMAELYLQQGFHDEALEVYRQLLKADPADEHLKQRVRKLARGDRDSMPFDLVPAAGAATSDQPATAPADPAAEPAPAPDAPAAPRLTARSYFALLAVKTAARGKGLDRLFSGGVVASDDEQSALLLSQVNGADAADVAEVAGEPVAVAADGSSLDAIFRVAAERTTPTVPRQSQTLRFDQFFATADDSPAPTPASTPAAPASSTPSGEPGSPAELKQFQSWLLGLKKQ